MDPYYADTHVTLYLGDSRQVLPALGGGADVIIADPPYGEVNLAWDIWPEGWLKVAAAHSRALWCFGSWRVFGPRWADFTDAGWKFAQDLVWQKDQGSGLHADRFRRVHETVTHWYRGPWGDLPHDVPRVASKNPADQRSRFRNQTPTHIDQTQAQPGFRVHRDGTRLQLSVIEAQSVRGSGHPTAKPISLLRDLVHYSCPADGLVLDPFAGSGSTLVAARELGRRSIGIEASEEYCELAAKRLAAIDAQPDLFTA